jgi:hypothetical protein
MREAFRSGGSVSSLADVASLGTIPKSVETRSTSRSEVEGDLWRAGVE